jgi:hypothetical protein
VAEEVSDLVGEGYPYPAGAGLEFKRPHIFDSGFASPAEKCSQPGQKAKAQTFFVVRSHLSLDGDFGIGQKFFAGSVFVLLAADDLVAF